MILKPKISWLMPCMLFSLLLSANAMQGEKNPFLQFAGKPYGSYHYALRDTLRERFDHDNAARIPLAVKQMREVPDVFHDHQWEIQADFIEICFLHDYRKGSDESYVKELKRLLEEVGNITTRYLSLESSVSCSIIRLPKTFPTKWITRGSWSKC